MQSLKSFFKIIFKVFLLLLILSLSSCHRKDKKFLIGVSQCSIDEWRDKQNREMESEALYQGVDIHILSVKDDSRKQVQDIRRLMDEGVDLLIISPNSAKEITSAVEEAWHRGIPVILMERKIDSDKYAAFIGADNYMIGKEAGNYLAYLLGGKGSVFEVQGLKGSTSANERHKGFMAALKAYPDIHYVGSIYAQWYEGEAGSKMDSVWRKFPVISAVFAQNDRMAKGVYQSAVRNHKTDGLKLVGIDGLSGKGFGVDEVIKKHLTATFIYPTDGDKVISLAMQILHKKPFPKNTELSTAVINDGNVHLIDYENRQMVAQEERIKILNGRIDNYFSLLNRQEVIFWSLGFILLTSITFLVFMIQAYRAKDKLNKLEKEQTKKIIKQKKQVEEQRDQLAEMSRQLEQATHAKLIFFTNVSHDFRTPLTLISSPVEELLSDKTLTEEQHFLLSIAYKNVKILLQLINELLDFRRYENGKMEMKFSTIPLADSVTEWSKSFAVQAQRQHVHFEIENNLPGKELTIIVDAEKLERILFNLLSNAFKFTPANGVVRILLSLEDEVVIRVYDSGKSIPKDKLQKIFDRFFTESIHHNGSGIGLALTKTFVELHNGTIAVESEKDKGCTFIVKIPLVQGKDTLKVASCEPAEPVTGSQEHFMSVRMEDSPLDNEQNRPFDEASNKPSLLIIDDNKDICHYLKDTLDSDYQVRYTESGDTGVRLAVKLVPDLIICDVMMPGMDGFTCCGRLKKEIQTCHIPIILLTACSLDEQRLKGFDCGADSYISKPFNLSVLKARIKNLIDSRRQLKVIFSASKGITMHEEAAKRSSSLDDSFINRLNTLIKKKMGDSSFSVDNMAEAMNLSRVQLYRKVKALSNYSPVEILRIMRLREAERQLLTTEKSVSEVAYEVGFTSPSYFTKCYKDYFGKNPTERHSFKD